MHSRTVEGGGGWFHCNTALGLVISLIFHFRGRLSVKCELRRGCRGGDVLCVVAEAARKDRRR